ELRLRVVQVVHVDALHAEVRAAALDLRAQEGRREAVIASDQLLRPAQARLDEALAYVLRVRPRRAGRCAVERDVAALGADDDLVAHGDPLLDGEAERAAERALAALAAVVDRGVQQVHAAGQARERRGLVALVVLRVALAQVGAQADGRDREPGQRAPVAGRTPNGVPRGVCGGGGGRGRRPGHATPLTVAGRPK